MSRVRAAFQGRRGAVLSVALIVWALALFDLTLLPRVSSQYLGTLPAKRLVGVTVPPGSTLMTSTDPKAPANLWILSRHGAATRVIGVPLPVVHTHRGARDKVLTARVRTTLKSPAGAPFDVEDWPGAGPTLFVISSPHRSPSVRLISLGTGRTVLESKVPLPPQKSDRRDFFIAHWSGPRPDLFVVERNVNRHRRRAQTRPWSVRVYTGESGFKKLALQTWFPRGLSRQLSEGNWWVNVGVRRPPKPSLVLVTRGETGTGQTEVHVLSGHSRFRYFTLHAGTELPDEEGPKRPFVFESERKGGTILMAKIQDGTLRLVPVPLP